MLIVNAQVHIWGAGPPTTRSHRQVEVFPAEELLHRMGRALLAWLDWQLPG